MNIRYNGTPPDAIRFRPEYEVVEVFSESASNLPTSLRYQGKMFNIPTVGRKVLNCELQAIEYHITIGKHKTKLWQDKAGTWYVRPKV